MKKIILLLLVIFLAATGYSQKVTISSKKLAKDTIVWKRDSLLKIEDFKGKTNKSLIVEGLACTGILFYPKENNGEMDFYVEAIFVKSKSFIKDNSIYTLKHEQLHFDIAELYARLLRQRLSQTDFKKVRNIVQEINGIYTRNYNEFDREEQKYDDDTQHGMNPAKQQVWEDNIKKQLEDLDSFSSTEVDVTK
jgi:anionic cell wall polymer biosynthesis LytR-Cps2A-Psr (LCP) family protein